MQTQAEHFAAQDRRRRLNIRKRERIDSSPPPGHSQSWLEFQVLDGRKILFRGSTLAEAQRFIHEYK